MNPDDSAPSTDVQPARGARWGQERRLQFIDFRLQWEGRINRSDLVKHFGISVPQASTDLSNYSDVAGDNLRYNPSEKSYFATPRFRPVFTTSGSQQYLAQLLALDRGVIRPDAVMHGKIPPVASVPNPTRTVNEETLKKLVYSVNEGTSLAVEYQSTTREEPTHRSISPHAFVHDGLRWHVRAYCHLRSKFQDFVVGRILSTGDHQPSAVRSEDDEEWHRELTVVLAPYPKLSAAQRRGIEIDYSMENGRVELKCRQAMLYYFLRRMNLDEEGQPRPHRQVVIANLEEIKPFLPKTAGAA